jgi:hypothetical protein
MGDAEPDFGFLGDRVLAPALPWMSLSVPESV